MNIFNPISYLNIFKNVNSGTKSKFSEVSIHDNLLVLPGRVIQISNISRVSSYGIKKSWMFRISMFIITLIFLSISLQQKTALFVCLTLVFCGLFLYAMFYKNFGIQVQTNGSTTDFLITKNQDVADNLYSMISYFINDIKGNKVVTIDNSLNITHGDKIMGDKFSDIENSDIVNRSVST